MIINTFGPVPAMSLSIYSIELYIIMMNTKHELVFLAYIYIAIIRSETETVFIRVCWSAFLSG